MCQLCTLNHEFDVLVMSEIWAYNITLFNNLIPGYCFYYDLPESSDVGGIGIYVKRNLQHHLVDCYKIVSSVECPVENLWLEVTKNSHKYQIFLFMHKYVHNRPRVPQHFLHILIRIKKFTSIIHGTKETFTPLLYLLKKEKGL